MTPTVTTAMTPVGWTIAWAFGIVSIAAVGAAIVATGLLVGKVSIAASLLGMRIARFFRGVAEDLVRAAGGAVVALILLPVALARGLIGRSEGAHRALAGSGTEARRAAASLYSAAIRRPAALLGLTPALTEVELRLPGALGDRAAGGSAIFAGYRILRELRRGGSGARLFVAEPDDATRRRIGLATGEVVVKSFDFDDGTGLAEMLRESRSLEAARRLGLVLESEAGERRFFYVMRYVEGVDLGTWVRRMHGEAGDRALDRAQVAEVAALVRDLVATLRDWHAAGLLHKDVKPENVVVASGRATLVDLGLVTPIGSHATLTTHGTEYFRDPELVRLALRGARVSDVEAARFDLYGAGAVLYFALEGTFPAHGPLSGFRKASPDALRWIARRAMADFAQRYGDADAMLRDLDVALAADDPFAVRPADLPSVRGEITEAPTASDAHDASEEARFLDATLAGRTATSSGAGVPPTDAPAIAATADPSAKPRRPAIAVRNWWTGSYAFTSLRPLPAAPPATEQRGAGAAAAVLVASIVILAIVVAAASILDPSVVIRVG